MCDLFDSEKKVVSWKFQEWDYGKKNIKLPCNARGLFILEDGDKPEIVARGYDKFFNVDEVPFTKWEYIEKNTVGPYDVTLKSNGCIIFISGLADGTLVVCSKHSTGARTDVDRNHAESGKSFLLKQLAKLEIESRQFAKRLHELNVTAVAEYCDDSFEEHILAYEGKKWDCTCMGSTSTNGISLLGQWKPWLDSHLSMVSNLQNTSNWRTSRDCEHSWMNALNMAATMVMKLKVLSLDRI